MYIYIYTCATQRYGQRYETLKILTGGCKSWRTPFSLKSSYTLSSLVHPVQIMEKTEISFFFFFFAWKEHEVRRNRGNREIGWRRNEIEGEREKKRENSTERTHALPVAAGASGRIRDVGRIRGWTDSTRWQGGSRGLTRGRGRNGPYDAHVAPTYPVLGRMLPRGLRALRQPTTTAASRHHRGYARPCCLMGHHHRSSAVQWRALRSEIQISRVCSRSRWKGWGIDFNF